MKTHTLPKHLLGAGAIALLTACGGGSDAPAATAVDDASSESAQSLPVSLRSAEHGRHGPHGHFNRKPGFVVGPVRSTEYDGLGDDLLTGGLGKTGLAGAAPTYADPLAPTAAELRRAAIYNNYRAIVDMTANGGYGRFYGPNVGLDGVAGPGEGKVAGTEVIAYSRGTGPRDTALRPTSQNVVLMVQIPASFDPRKPCIVTATSSGSRGVYGAISTGEWGLKRGCAVAYNDKGTGAAPHDLANDTVPLIDGTRASATLAGDDAQFSAPLSAAELAAFNAAAPNRFAFKHAHSQRNPEKDWGRYTLQAVEFAYWVLNERYGVATGHGERVRRIRPGNTIVIASSLSNGGHASIAAAEQDRDRLIDGVAVSEPSIEMPASPKVAVRRGGVLQASAGRTLFDYTSYANLYQGCALLAPQVAGAPGSPFVVASFAANRCAALKGKGLLSADTLTGQAEEAQARLLAGGWEPESAVLHTSLAAFEVASAVSVTYANALARASVADGLCGYSFSATTATGALTTIAPAALAQMAATGNGVPPSSGVQLVNDRNVGGPVRDILSVSPSTGLQDYNADGAACLHGLVSGSDATARALQAGVDETRRNGNLQRKPTIIVHGRADALIPVNHSSRPYTALNKAVEGKHSRLSYIEVENAQHFDTFIGLPTLLAGYDTRYVPLHLYLFRALDAMYAHLSEGQPLPASQVVRTVPRGGVPGAAPELTASNVPNFVRKPAKADAIVAKGHTLYVPE